MGGGIWWLVDYSAAAPFLTASIVLFWLETALPEERK